MTVNRESLPFRNNAPTLEGPQYGASQGLIDHLGPAHCAFRVRVRRGSSVAVGRERPAGRRPAALCR
jgi:hypothetical protein